MKSEVKTVGSAITVRHLESDPFLVFRRLRAAEPISWVPAIDRWLITTARDVKRVVRDQGAFPLEADSIDQVLGPNLLTMGAEAHRRARRLLGQAFNRSAITSVARHATDAALQPILDVVAENGRAEVVTAICQPISAQAVTAVFELDSIDPTELIALCDSIALGISPFSDRRTRRLAAESRQQLDRLLTQVVKNADTERGTFLGRLLSRVDGDRFTVQEAVSHLQLALTGLREPGDLIALALYHLVTNPDSLQIVRQDLGLVPAACEEALRLSTIFGISPHRTSRATVIRGVTIPPGAKVWAMLASANRDAELFDSPDSFQLVRVQQAHVSFSEGPHYCLGAPLVRAIACAAVRGIVAALPDLRLNPSRAPIFEGWWARVPVELDLRWTTDSVRLSANSQRVA